MNGRESDFPITEEDMESLYAFYDNVKKELNNIKDEINLLWSKIEN